MSRVKAQQECLVLDQYSLDSIGGDSRDARIRGTEISSESEGFESR